MVENLEEIEYLQGQDHPNFHLNRMMCGSGICSQTPSGEKEKYAVVPHPPPRDIFSLSLLTNAHSVAPSLRH